jgi:hypothetical protein
MRVIPEVSIMVSAVQFRRSLNAGNVARALLAIVIACASAFAARGATAQPQHRTFAVPEDAVEALVKAARAGNLDELLTLFGPEGQELIASSDPATARKNRRVFTVAAAERRVLVDDGTNRKTLVIGHEEWPFPVPLVKDDRGWRFDTAAGKEEIIARRIGRNELAAIETCRAYVTAQQRYAQDGHDGLPSGIYALRFRSDPGKQNGLYWPAAKGEKRSPLGDLAAQAAEEGVVARPGGRTPLHGYFFKILSSQGARAPGGRKSYINKGVMSGGFALVAWPAEYDVTGVMSFIVNQDGVVYEKDLGRNSQAIASKMNEYNPDGSWRPVE